MLKGAEWREMRNRLSPAFTTSKLRAMLPLIERCCKQFAKFLMNRPDAQSEPIEFKSAFTRFSNDVIATVAFGYEVNAIDDPENIFYKNAFSVATLVTFKGKRLLVLFGYMIFPKLMQFLGIPFIPKSVTKFFQNLITSAINQRVKSGVVMFSFAFIRSEKFLISFEFTDSAGSAPTFDGCTKGRYCESSR
jgi:cytochrome P450 family 9